MAGLNGNHRKLLPFLALLLLIFTGCAGPLEVKYEPRTEGQFKSKEAAAIFVSLFEDKRNLSKSPFKDPRTIGRIQATVSDMTGDKLTLSENVADIVSNAYAKELALAGFTIVNEPDKAKYLISGEVRQFRLYVGSQDEIAIELSYELKEAQGERTLSSGVVSEKGDRFAGVMGNSRTTLSNHISASLQKAIRRSIADIGARLPASENAPAAKEEPRAQPSQATGAVAVNSTPERAKVYIDGVYYGLTPMTADLAPGVYGVTIKKKGFNPAVEKVSVRQGATTEIEMELDGE